MSPHLLPPLPPTGSHLCQLPPVPAPSARSCKLPPPHPPPLELHRASTHSSVHASCCQLVPLPPSPPPSLHPQPLHPACACCHQLAPPNAPLQLPANHSSNSSTNPYLILASIPSFRPLPPIRIPTHSYMLLTLGISRRLIMSQRATRPLIQSSQPLPRGPLPAGTL